MKYNDLFKRTARYTFICSCCERTLKFGRKRFKVNIA